MKRFQRLAFFLLGALAVFAQVPEHFDEDAYDDLLENEKEGIEEEEMEVDEQDAVEAEEDELEDDEDSQTLSRQQKGYGSYGKRHSYKKKQHYVVYKVWVQVGKYWYHASNARIQGHLQGSKGKSYTFNVPSKYIRAGSGFDFSVKSPYLGKLSKISFWMSPRESGNSKRHSYKNSGYGKKKSHACFKPFDILVGDKVVVTTKYCTSFGYQYKNEAKKGYKSNHEGGYKDEEGGYKNDHEEGGYKNDHEEGGYKNDHEEGGYKNDHEEGGYKNDHEEGSYKNDHEEGDYKNDEEGYKNDRESGYKNDDDYQNDVEGGSYTLSKRHGDLKSVHKRVQVRRCYTEAWHGGYFPLRKNFRCNSYSYPTRCDFWVPLQRYRNNKYYHKNNNYYANHDKKNDVYYDRYDNGVYYNCHYKGRHHDQYSKKAGPVIH